MGGGGGGGGDSLLPYVYSWCSVNYIPLLSLCVHDVASSVFTDARYVFSRLS